MSMFRIPQNTEDAEYQHIVQNTPEHARIPTYRGAFLVLLLFGGGVAFALMSAPAAAQVTTVTPYPEAVATATAAAQQMSDAAQAKAQAAQEADQARANAAAADAQFNAAQQAANEARSLLASQQIAAASEALGRAEGAIANGKSIISDTLRWLDSLAATNSRQAEQITLKDRRIAELENEARQLKTDKQTILANYNALMEKATESESRLFVNPAVAALFMVVAGAMVLLVVTWKLSRRDPPSPASHAQQPTLEGEYTEYTVSREDDLT